MTKNLLEIEQILREGNLEKAHQELLELLEKEPENDSAWYMLGGIFDILYQSWVLIK